MAYPATADERAASPAVDPLRPVEARVTRVQRETSDTWTLELEPVEGRRPDFAPGQFNMLYAFGVGASPISVSGDPADADRWVHTIRAVGPVTRALCESRPGTIVGVTGPFGTAWPVEEGVGRDVIVMAGGIGLAPLRPALHRLLAERGRYGRVFLLYGARSPGDLLYRDALAGWRGRFDLEVEVTVDHAPADWHGDVGVVTRLLTYAPFDPENAVAFLCGPEVMMRFGAKELESRGVTADRMWVSLERNMECGAALCGHCQLGPYLICRDGAVFRLSEVEDLMRTREL